jgi:hypothetical protein
MTFFMKFSRILGQTLAVLTYQDLAGLDQKKDLKNRRSWGRVGEG